LKIVSFYSPEPYYSGAASNLSADLKRLNISHVIEPYDSTGQTWPEITCYKIEFILKCMSRFRDERIVWIDVDTRINWWPDPLNRFSSDLIGFPRAFAKVGKLNTYQRFWSPMLLGFRRTPPSRELLEEALKTLERPQKLPVTDDFLIEEAWRKVGDSLSFQILPSSLIRVDSERFQSTTPAFELGSSGNVVGYRSQVAAHSPRVRTEHSITSVRKLLLLAAYAAKKKLVSRRK
jgi:hypothetical protein